MRQATETIKKYLGNPYIIGFLFALAVGYGANFYNALNPAPISSDDPYFNIASGIAKHEGSEVTMPVLTTRFTKPAEHYIGYHSLLGIFLRKDLTPRDSVARAEAVHVALASITAFIFFLIAHSLSQSVSTALFSSIIGFFSYTFPRLITVRADIIVILLFIATCWSIAKKKYLLLFLASCTFPLVYSTPLVIVFPAGIYFIAAVLQKNLSANSAVKIVCVSVGGALIGTLLHPAPLNYLYTGTWLNLRSLFFAGTLPAPAEFALFTFSIQDIPWMLLTLVLISTHVLIYLKNNLRALPIEHLFFLMLSGAFFFLQFTAIRFSVYFYPLLGLFAAVTTSKLTTDFGNIKILFRPWVLGFFGIAAAMYAYPFYLETAAQHPVDLYKESTAYLENSGERIFIGRFDMYPRIIFYNPRAQITSGLNNIFMEAYDQKIAELYLLVWMRMLPPSVAADAYGARYIIDDGLDTAYSSLLNSDACAQNVFTDPHYPQMKVFEVRQNCEV